MRYGVCDYCGRKGVTTWIVGKDKVGGKFMLACYGADIHCCNWDHYVRFRNGEKPKDLRNWMNQV